ncbi:MAG: hypothetical protein EXS05_12375 [Planctomycetaceae bacterium]|nr:hypothetical protein [Planctomycetaceae bacterium]
MPVVVEVGQVADGIPAQSGKKRFLVSRLGMAAVEIVADTVEDVVRLYNRAGVTSMRGTDFARSDLLIKEKP